MNKEDLTIEEQLEKLQNEIIEKNKLIKEYKIKENEYKLKSSEYENQMLDYDLKIKELEATNKKYEQKMLDNYEMNVEQEEVIEYKDLF